MDEEGTVVDSVDEEGTTDSMKLHRLDRVEVIAEAEVGVVVEGVEVAVAVEIDAEDAEAGVEAEAEVRAGAGKVMAVAPRRLSPQIRVVMTAKKNASMSSDE